MLDVGSGWRYLTEIRHHATNWWEAFERESHWILEDGLIARIPRHYEHGAYRGHRTSNDWRVAEVFYELLSVEQATSLHPAIGLAMASQECPFVGPPRGYLAWTIDTASQARQFGMDSGRAGGLQPSYC